MILEDGTHMSDMTEGFIELLEEVSHDPDEFDAFDLLSYIEALPNPYRVLKEFGLYVHAEYL
jgi:hypothetical protein